MRLLFLIAFIYFGFKVLKFFFKALDIFKTISTNKTFSSSPPTKIDDVMIQDPYCKVYFPKKDGIHLKDKGKNLYFCSSKCRDKYLDEQNN
ncbi:MAG TPA: hypothetical protein DD405_04750 [Desulfobacteraceae bacterium]|nr:hypothetical protein [Desulfobacteraceae bacterium]